MPAMFSSPSAPKIPPPKPIQPPPDPTLSQQALEMQRRRGMNSTTFAGDLSRGTSGALKTTTGG